MFEYNNEINVGLVYHELGHLIVDILITKKFPKFKIIGFNISNFVYNSVVFNKKGSLLENEFSEDFLSLSYVSLTFGSIFQSLYVCNVKDSNSSPYIFLKSYNTGGDDLAKIKLIHKGNKKLIKITKYHIEKIFEELRTNEKIKYSIEKYSKNIVENLKYCEDLMQYRLGQEFINNICKKIYEDEGLNLLYELIFDFSEEFKTNLS